MFKPFRLGLRLFTFLSFAWMASHPAMLSAQQTRVAYIDASKLLKRMPEALDAQTRVEQLIATWSREAGDMQNELDRKLAEFERRKLIMTDAERTAADVELQNLRKKLDDYRHQKFDQNGGELFTQQATIMKPAYERLENAIREAAAEGNFDYAFDCSSKDIVMLYKNAKFDLTIPVARKLGIESEILSTPLINSNPKGNSPGAKTPGTPPKPPPGMLQPGEAPPAPPPGGINPGVNPIPPPIPGKK